MINPNTIFTTDNLLTGRTQIEASFGANKEDFEVDENNILNLKNKTSYLSIPGTAFDAVNPNSDDIRKDAATTNGGYVIAQTDNINFVCAINIPHNAIVTEVKVYSDQVNGTMGWVMYRVAFGDGFNPSSMASGSINTADDTITDGTIDNENYTYYIRVNDVDTDGIINGVRIEYTTDYD